MMKYEIEAIEGSNYMAEWGGGYIPGTFQH